MAHFVEVSDISLELRSWSCSKCRLGLPVGLKSKHLQKCFKRKPITVLIPSIYFLNGVALDRGFGFAGAAAVLRLAQVQVLALDRRFVLHHARMTSCHARDDIRPCPE